MLSEIFQKPKPVLGTVQLLPLPGSTDWNGRLEQVIARAEQEATALASGGVDGIILENFYDEPYRLDRIDTAGAIAMALIARRIKKFTPLPLGISVLGNDPQTAFAIAMNVGAEFIRVPVLVGSIITDSGLAEGKMQTLAEYKNLLKPLAAPKIFVDITLNHLVPGRILTLMSGPQKGFVPADFLINHLRQVATSVEQHGMAHALILDGREVTPVILEALKQSSNLPLFVEDPLTPEVAGACHQVGDGLLLSKSVKKMSVPGMDVRTTVDMFKVEEVISCIQSHADDSTSLTHQVNPTYPQP